MGGVWAWFTDRRRTISESVNIYCSLLRHRASRLSTLWLVNEGVISHEDPEMGRQDESHDRARGPQRQTGGDDLPRASDQGAGASFCARPTERGGLVPTRGIGPSLGPRSARR